MALAVHSDADMHFVSAARLLFAATLLASAVLAQPRSAQACLKHMAVPPQQLRLHSIAGDLQLRPSSAVRVGTDASVVGGPSVTAQVRASADADGTVSIASMRVTSRRWQASRAWVVDGPAVQVEREAESGALAVGVDVFSLHHRGGWTIGDSAWRVTLDADLVASVVQGIWLSSPAFDGLGGALLPCSSRSTLGVAVGLAYGDFAFVKIGGEMQGDPFHFGSGGACLGRGTAWTSSETLALRVGVNATESSVIALELSGEVARLFARRSAGQVDVYEGTNVRAQISWTLRT